MDTLGLRGLLGMNQRPGFRLSGSKDSLDNGSRLAADRSELNGLSAAARLTPPRLAEDNPDTRSKFQKLYQGIGCGILMALSLVGIAGLGHGPTVVPVATPPTVNVQPPQEAEITAPTVVAPSTPAPQATAPKVDHVASEQAPARTQRHHVTHHHVTHHHATHHKAAPAPVMTSAPAVETPVVEAPIIAPEVTAENLPPVIDFSSLLPGQLLPSDLPAPEVEAPVVQALVVEAPVVQAPVVDAPVVQAPEVTRDNSNLLPGQLVPDAPAQAAQADPLASVDAAAQKLNGNSQVNTGLEVSSAIPLAGTAIETVTAINAGNAALALGAQAQSLGAAAQAAAAAGNLQQAATLGTQAQKLGAEATGLGAKAQAAAAVAKPLSIVGGGIAVVDGGIDIGKGIHGIHEANKLQRQADAEVATLSQDGQMTPELQHEYGTVKTDLHHDKTNAEKRTAKGTAKVVFGGMMIASPFTGPAAPIVGGVGAVGYLGTSVAGHVHPVKAVKSVGHALGHLFHHHKKVAAAVVAAPPLVAPVVLAAPAIVDPAIPAASEATPAPTFVAPSAQDLQKTAAAATDTGVNSGLEIGAAIPLVGTAAETVTAINAGNAALALGAQAQSLGAAAQAAAAAGNLQQAASLGAQAQKLGGEASGLGAHAQAAAAIAKPLSIVGGGIAVVDGTVDIVHGVSTMHHVDQLQKNADVQVANLTKAGQMTPEVQQEYSTVKTELHHDKTNAEKRTAKGTAKVVFGGMMIASPFTGPAAPIVGGVGAAGYLTTSLIGHVHPIQAVRSVFHHIFHHHDAKPAHVAQLKPSSLSSWAPRNRVGITTAFQSGWNG